MNLVNLMNDDAPLPSPFRPLGMVAMTGLAGALAFLLATRPLPEARAAGAGPGEQSPTQTDAPTQTETPRAGTSPTLASTDAGPAPTDASGPDPAPAAPATIRVVGLGWELLTPGLLANDGLEGGEDSEFQAAGIDAQFAVASSIESLEARLARGGEVEDGADVAILPLPTFVASYERLRALAPEVLFVVAWSHGRDALVSENAELLVSSPPRGTVPLVGQPGQSATMLSLFALDELGVDPSTIELVSPVDEDARRAKLRALERSLLASSLLGGVDPRSIDARDLVLTSADAPRLIPMVAVAPASFVHDHTDALARFVRVWHRGAAEFSADAPTAARAIATQRGAPEAVALLGTMAYISFAELDEAVRLAGLSGRDALSLEYLFHRSWQLWREVGVLSTPAPEHAPLDNSVLARVALGEGAGPIRAREDPAREGRRVILRRSLPGDAKLDEAELVIEIGILAGVFERGEIELRIRRDKAASRAIVDEAIQRFDLDPDHVRVGPRIRSQAAAELRVYVP